MLPLDLLLWVLCVSAALIAASFTAVVVLGVAVGIANNLAIRKRRKNIEARRQHPSYGGLHAVPRSTDCE